MSRLLSLVDWLWVNFYHKGTMLYGSNEWMNCLLLVCSLSEVYTVLLCIYELKCFIERCSDACCFSKSKMVRKIKGDFMEMDFSVLFCLKDCNHTILLLAWPLTLHNTSCIKAAIQCITAHCFYVHCHLNICCDTLGQCSISQIGINKDRAFCGLSNYINGCCA